MPLYPKGIEIFPLRGYALLMRISQPLLASMTLLLAGLLQAQVEVVATGLQGPSKLILTQRGNFLASETSLLTNSGRVAFVSRSGVRRSFMTGLPSGTELTGGGAGPSAMALRDRTLYLAIGGGDVERRNATGQSVHNPDGVSSPIFNSIIEIRLSTDIDSLAGTFTMTPEHQQILADGGEVELNDGVGGTARLSLLVDFPDSLPDGKLYRFSNIWGMALSTDGSVLWVIDASQNLLYRVETATGRRQTWMRFPQLANPSPIGPRLIDSVPTSVRVYGQQLLVSFLTGFPFSKQYSRVLAVNIAQRTTEPFILSVTSAVDILWRERPSAGRSQFFVLEFSQDQFASPVLPGRLWRYDTADQREVAGDLRGPVSMAFDPATEDMFVLEVSGRILKVSAK